MNKFKIIITSYNNEKWTEICINSVLSQTYTNYEVLFFDDASSDKTFDIALNLTGKDNRFKLKKLESNKTKSYIFANYIDEHINDKDIVVFLDGDDWLSSEEVLNAVNQTYELYDPWVAYGGMVCWDGGDTVTEANPQNTKYSVEILENREFRRDWWRSSHLKTMRGFIWKSIDKDDFISKQDGLYILGGDDLAFMFPAMEMCVPSKNKISIFSFPTYVYNATNQQRIKDHMTIRKKDYEGEIRSRKKHDLLPIITSNLSGGLGNQMFQIATTISLAKKLKYVAMFDPNSHFLPLQGRNIKTYENNVFRNIIFSKDLSINNVYTQPGFHYTPLEGIPPLTILKGGYQSEKYFDNELVKEIFSVPADIRKHLNEKYGDVSDKISIQVRRGDFLKHYPYHVFVGEEYYTKAMSMFPNKKFVVSSDDLEWCKTFFVGKQFEFIKDEDYNELYLMSLCGDNIIGNSTFGWWVAWLNPNINKKVIAPTNWFGPGYSHFNINDLIPETWIKI